MAKSIQPMTNSKLSSYTIDSVFRWHNTNDDDKCSITKIDQYVDEWIKFGARAIGGCCRVMVDDIARIAKVIQNHI